MYKLNIFILLLMAALPAVGCTRADGRHALSGSVSLDGKPLKSGSINFRPVDAAKGNSSGGTIKDGRFEIAAEKGLPAGKYSVTIQAFRSTGRTMRDPQMGNVPQMAPIRFREAGVLEATVAAGGDNRSDFKLTQKD